MVQLQGEVAHPNRLAQQEGLNALVFLKEIPEFTYGENETQKGSQRLN